MLAKAASLDHVSGGRIDLGLGAGGSWDGIAAMAASGGVRPEAVAALQDALEVLRAFASGRRGLRASGAT